MDLRWQNLKDVHVPVLHPSLWVSDWGVNVLIMITNPSALAVRQAFRARNYKERTNLKNTISAGGIGQAWAQYFLGKYLSESYRCGMISLNDSCNTTRFRLMPSSFATFILPPAACEAAVYFIGVAHTMSQNGKSRMVMDTAHPSTC
ncbi:hypothetical protein BDR05DRAFT_31735 [Suillus weaverae]|nr:hypothetical protein BDR05DRAFT_31735 [Suillus weaverae]